MRTTHVALLSHHPSSELPLLCIGMCCEKKGGMEGASGFDGILHPPSALPFGSDTRQSPFFFLLPTRPLSFPRSLRLRLHARICLARNEWKKFVFSTHPIPFSQSKCTTPSARFCCSFARERGSSTKGRPFPSSSTRCTQAFEPQSSFSFFSLQTVSTAAMRSERQRSDGEQTTVSASGTPSSWEGRG